MGLGRDLILLGKRGSLWDGREVDLFECLRGVGREGMGEKSVVRWFEGSDSEWNRGSRVRKLLSKGTTNECAVE